MLTFRVSGHDEQLVLELGEDGLDCPRGELSDKFGGFRLAYPYCTRPWLALPRQVPLFGVLAAGCRIFFSRLIFYLEMHRRD